MQLSHSFSILFVTSAFFLIVFFFLIFFIISLTNFNIMSVTPNIFTYIITTVITKDKSKSRIPDLQNQINELKTKISTIKHRISNLENLETIEEETIPQLDQDLFELTHY